MFSSAAHSGQNGSRPVGRSGDLLRRPRRVYDFASFVVVFYDIFVKDQYYRNFGTINDMRISHEIASGHQFSVRLYRLTDRESVRTSDDPYSRLTTGTQVVLKWPNLSDYAGSSQEEEVIRAITTELSVISHPGVREHPRVLDVYGFAWYQEGTGSGASSVPVFMIEYGELGTLDNYLRGKKDVDLDTKLLLASDIAHALQALHQNGIAHSDLKPENILICRHSDGRPIAKLSDFGFSIFLEQHDSTVPWGVGTPGWWSPEHSTLVDKDKLPKTDIYSCGLVLWSILLNGRQPLELADFKGNLKTFKLKQNDLLGLLEIIRKSLRDVDAVPEARMEEITEIFESLLTRPEDRSLSLLLRLQPNLPSAQSGTTDGSPIQRRDNTRSVTSMHDFGDMANFPGPVKEHILSAFSNILGRSDEEAAEAHYVAAIMTLLRIGTVSLGPTGYTGYDIDATKVLCLLMSAANGTNDIGGSPRAQAIYHHVSKALTTSLVSQHVLANVINMPKDTLVPLQTTTRWLKQAVTLGSHIASSTLRELDYEAWKETLQSFRTEYCGVGRRLLENDECKPYVAEPSSLLNKSASDSIGAFGDTALHVAATLGRLDIVQHLTDGAPATYINKQNSRGETALLQAARCGRSSIVEHLIASGASGAILTDNSESPLHWLCAFVDLDEEELSGLAMSLYYSGGEIDGVCTANTVFNDHFQDSLGGGTPLCRAVQRDVYVAAKVLVDMGANPYKDRELGTSQTAPHAAALACRAHNSRMLSLFLTCDTPLCPPNWYGFPGFFDPEYMGEAVLAWLNGAETYQIAAPNAWKSMVGLGDQCSLLGYAVNPDPLHERMARLGASYLEEMQQTIDILATLELQDFDRVTHDYHSALMHSVLSRDLSLVSHLLSTYPDQTLPALTNPVPSSSEMRLPVQLALLQGEKPIFDLLLRYAGPDATVGITQMQGLTDNWLSQAMLSLTYPEATIAAAEASEAITNTVHLASGAHPDPHYMRALLSNLPTAEARRLANSHSKAGDVVPLTLALANNNFDVADVLLEYGANVNEEAGHQSGGPRQTRTPLGAVITFNNRGTIGAVDWLLRHGASLVTNREVGFPAFVPAIRAGMIYEYSMSNILIPARLDTLQLPVLERLVNHFSRLDQINHQAEGYFGMTALHFAVLRLSTEAVDLLLKAGADPDIKAQFDEPQSARELADSLGEDNIPAEAKARGPDEIQNYLTRFTRIQSIINSRR
ncbi:hypothetical protein DER46DRAFT_650445 [Fusarium sp. MPI-SDFR-AT-0072]|nr:hypothetical protein DER46DRAFT_650445 [Fusarium sp. MPI-SDFR-AT-0072]